MIDISKGMRPIELAKALYRAKGKVFEDVFCEYLARNDAHIISRPTCFLMAKPMRLESGALAWFVQVGTGKLRELVAALPDELPFIAFCRHRDVKEKLRVYPWREFKRKALAL